MDRNWSFLIDDDLDGKSTEQVLRQLHFSKQCRINLKRDPEGVLVDGKPRFLNQPLKKGETLVISLREEKVSEKIPAIELPLSIVYEDEDLIVLDKPAGMPIHPSMNHYYNSLANGLAWYYEKQGKPFVFRCVNRLDRDTSGLTIVAKNLYSASILSELTVNRKIHREYRAIVRGHVTPPFGTIDAPLGRKPGSIIEREINFETGERAVTHYRTLSESNGHTLLGIQLETGRTHQIRIHMKYLGFPLVGDYLYHPDMEWISRQALHSYRLSFPHPATGKPLEFVSPLPEDMQCVLTGTKKTL